MDCGHDSYEEVEANTVAGLQARVDRLAADARDARGSIWIIGKRVVHIVGQLAMHTDRLKAVEDGVTGTLEHLVGRW